MLEVIRNAFKNPDLRKKIFYTLMILLIFRIGAAIPAPFVDASALVQLTGDGSNFFGYLNMLSGGAFQDATIFAMSITPYINASIIIQLLTVAIPALERLAKEGGEGRKKLNKITRWCTVGIALLQATGYYFLMRNYNAIPSDYTSDAATTWFTGITIVLVFTAGAALIMWLGEQINDKGIGNGISIILFAGIIARGPDRFCGDHCVHRNHDECRTQDSGILRETCGWSENVWRPVLLHSDQGKHERRYADHLRQCVPFSAEHDPDVLDTKGRQLLGACVQRTFSAGRGVCDPLLFADHRVQLFLYFDPIQSD